MSKKPAKEATTSASASLSIEEQTAAFLKKGGAIEYIVKGKSGQVVPPVTKPLNPKKT